MKGPIIFTFFVTLLLITVVGCNELPNGNQAGAEPSAQSGSPDNQNAKQASGTDISDNQNTRAVLSDSEVISLVESLCEKGDDAFAWYFAQGAGLKLDEPSPGPRLVLGPFKTITELKEATEAVFTKRFCEDVLYPFGLEGDTPVFVEVDGVLHFNLVDGIINNEILTNDITIKENTPDKIVVEIISNHFDPDIWDRRPVAFEFTLIYEDSSWKLDNWFNFITEYGTHIG